MTLLVDSHCHLDLLDLNHHDGDIENVLTAARDNGVCQTWVTMRQHKLL